MARASCASILSMDSENAFGAGKIGNGAWHHFPLQEPVAAAAGPAGRALGGLADGVERGRRAVVEEPRAACVIGRLARGKPADEVVAGEVRPHDRDD